MIDKLTIYKEQQKEPGESLEDLIEDYLKANVTAKFLTKRVTDWFEVQIDYLNEKQKNESK